MEIVPHFLGAGGWVGGAVVGGVRVGGGGVGVSTD